MPLVQQSQGLLPPLALCASADSGTVGGSVVLQRCWPLGPRFLEPDVCLLCFFDGPMGLSGTLWDSLNFLGLSVPLSPSISLALSVFSCPAEIPPIKVL